MSKVWTPDAAKSGDSFVAVRKYTVAGSISIFRWGLYEDMQVEVGMGRSFDQLQAAFTEIHELANRMAQGQHLLADIAIKARDGAMGCTLAHAREPHVVLKMCALFLNYEGEDTRYIDDTDIAAKIQDWTEAGVSMNYFFQFAFRSIPGFIAAYQASFPTTSPRTGGQSPNPSSAKDSPDTVTGSSSPTTGPSSND